MAGLFKQYEIIPVLGTPQDVFDLRIKYRGEDFYLYRTNVTPEQGRLILLAVARRLNGEREFYNTLTRNCSTSLAPLVEVVGKEPFRDIRVLFAKYAETDRQSFVIILQRIVIVAFLIPHVSDIVVTICDIRVFFSQCAQTD